MIITVYNDVIPHEVVENQRKVFEKFGEKIIQIKPKVWEGHAHTVDSHFMGLYSVAQNPNHIPGAPDYASPAFIAFSKKTYEELGRPSFQGTKIWDVGGELTYRAREKNMPVVLMYPSHVEIPKWKFKDGKMFGIGTTYANKIYHHFEGRRVTKSFLDKCKQILL